MKNLKLTLKIKVFLGGVAAVLGVVLNPGVGYAAWSELNRTYQASSGDHFYTTEQSEVLAAQSGGYVFEGFIGYVQTTTGVGTRPLYRAYNPNTGEHFYTINQAEHDGLNGWVKEGVRAHVAQTLANDTKPLYRIYLTTGFHFYTTNLAEKNTLVSQGHAYEGVTGYLYKTSPDVVPTYKYSYLDGRPAPQYRQATTDMGAVLQSGNTNDARGARDVYVYEENGTYYMTYDGATTTNWSVNLATSFDLINWTKHGQKLSEPVSCGCYGTIHKNGTEYLMYYIGSPAQHQDTTPLPPYDTRLASGPSPSGPWTKEGLAFPLKDYYRDTGSPGPIIEKDGKQLMFFSAMRDGKRGLGIARADSKRGPWVPDAQPIIPLTEQVENIAIHQEGDTWYLFTNHVGINSNGEYTDSIWMYWSKDINNWNTANKAVVVDGQTSNWSKLIIGLPSVVKVGNRLAVLYDGNVAPTYQGHLFRDIGLTWVDLPIKVPN